MNHLFFLFIIALLFQCCGIKKQPSIPDCENQIENQDFTMVNISNTETHKIIYVTRITSNTGNELPLLAGMKKDSILPNTIKSFQISNTDFNHFYFYTNNNFTEQFGRLIYKNTYPTLLGLNKIEVKISGSFLPRDNQLSIINAKGTSFCIKNTQNEDWRTLRLDDSNNNTFNTYRITRCCAPVSESCSPIFTTYGPSAENFAHLYFFRNTSSNCSGQLAEAALRARLIYRNSNAGKIRLNKIYIQPE
jgi:hypothetical protein